MQALVLASESQYRRELLSRLNLPFTAVSPNVDESPHQGESPDMLAARLARDKAQAVNTQWVSQDAQSRPIILASDQVAACDDVLLGKPRTYDQACTQLQAMAGKDVIFYTALYMLQSSNDSIFSALDKTVVSVRSLCADEIKRYIDTDMPLDCAGSFKVESLGVSLFDSVSSEDPTALIGLPLIAVARGLRRFGISIP